MIKLAERDQRSRRPPPRRERAGGGGEGGEPRPTRPRQASEGRPEGAAADRGPGEGRHPQHAVAGERSGERISPVDLLKQEGYGETLKEFDAKAREQRFRPASASNVSGSVLLPQPVAEEIIPILYPPRLPPRATRAACSSRRHLSTGPGRRICDRRLRRRGREEAGRRAPTFDDIDNASHKLAGIVYMTNEAAKWTIGRLEEYVPQRTCSGHGPEDGLGHVFSHGGRATPTGIFNQPGITVLDGSGTGSSANNRPRRCRSSTGSPPA